MQKKTAQDHTAAKHTDCVQATSRAPEHWTVSWSLVQQNCSSQGCGVTGGRQWAGKLIKVVQGGVAKMLKVGGDPL